MQEYSDRAAPAVPSPRRLIRGIEARLRRGRGIVEFDHSPECLLRIAAGHAERAIVLADGTRLRSGDAIVEIHLWNDHVAPIPARGPEFRWAVRTRRQLERSLRLLADHLETTPEFDDAVALVMKPAFVGRQLDRSITRILQKHGFDGVPTGAHADTTNAAHRFLDNLWLFLLAWTFNRQSLRGRPFRQIRQEFWMSRARLRALFGARPVTPRDGAARAAPPLAE
jgi:hypothetical protein